jgi:hypothetical protein
MKRLKILVAGLAVALSSPLLAADVPGGNQGLAQLDAIINYCSGLDPALQKAGQQRLSAITGKASPQELAAARASDEYREVYEATTTQLGSLEREQALQQCKALGSTD